MRIGPKKKKNNHKHLFCLSHKTWTSGHTVSGEIIFFFIEVIQTKKAWDKGQDYMITIFVTHEWMDLSGNQRWMAVDTVTWRNPMRHLVEAQDTGNKVPTLYTSILPWWLGGKQSACQRRRHRFHPPVRKIPWRRKWQPTPVFLPGKSHGQRSLAGYSPGGHKRVGHDLATKQYENKRYWQAQIIKSNQS